MICLIFGMTAESYQPMDWSRFGFASLKGMRNTTILSAIGPIVTNLRLGGENLAHVKKIGKRCWVKLVAFYL